MAPINQPKILRSLAEEAVYQCIQRRVFGTTPAAIEKALTYVRFMQKYKFMRQFGEQNLAHTNFAQTLATFPASFLKDCIDKMFEVVAKETCGKTFQNITVAMLSGENPDPEQSMKAHIRKRLHAICMHVLTPKMTSIDLSPISNEIFNHIVGTFSWDYTTEDFRPNIANLLMLHVRYNQSTFFDLFLDWSDSFAHVTSLTIRNHASPELLWLICCTCPSLRHLNLQGLLCNFKRYCDDFTRIDFTKSEYKQLATIDDGLPKFIETLSGVYGSNRGKHTFKGRPHHLKELRTFILPDLLDDGDPLEDKLALKVKNILQKCVNLEELSNVNLIRAIRLMNQEKEKVPRVLNLKKFHVSCCQDYEENVESELQKVKLPRVQDVHITDLDDVTILDNFPNMKHFNVNYDLGSSSFSLASILPYLRNLHTFRLDFAIVLSLDDVCIIAEQCPFLEYFRLVCSGLYNEVIMRTPQHITNSMTSSDESCGANANEANCGGKMSERRETKKNSMTNHEKICPWRDSDGWQQNLDFMERWMKTDRAEYEDDPSRIPKFSRLRKLKFDCIEDLDLAAMYKCIKGSPNLHTFIYLEELDTELINDSFVYKISQIMPSVKHVTLETCEGIQVLEDLTCISVKHLVDNCRNIQTITGVGQWNMMQEEVDYLNDKFKKQNLILRLTLDGYKD